jgi:hypothetical protein
MDSACGRSDPLLVDFSRTKVVKVRLIGITPVADNVVKAV